MRPHRWQPTRLPHPWDSPGKNTGVGCHFLLQCTKVKNESEVTQSCPTPSDPLDCSLPGSSVHGIFQTRVLEWGAIAFSGSWLGRGQVNMVDEAKLYSLIHSTFEVLVVQHAVRRCHGEWGPFCWLKPAAGIAVFSASHWSAEHSSQIQWFHQDSESCSGSEGQQTKNSDHDLFWVQVWLWEVLFSFLVQPLNWSSQVV